MIYRVATLDVLIEEVEAQGGAVLAEKCLPEAIEFKPPQREIEDSYTCGCGNFTRFASPYETESESGNFVTACAVCDNVGAWPRFEDVVKDDDSTYWDEIAATEEGHE